MQVPEIVVEILVCGWCLENGMALSGAHGNSCNQRQEPWAHCTELPAAMKMDCVSSIQQAAAKPQAAAEHLHGAAEELHFFFSLILI